MHHSRSLSWPIALLTVCVLILGNISFKFAATQSEDNNGISSLGRCLFHSLQLYLLLWAFPLLKFGLGLRMTPVFHCLVIKDRAGNLRDMLLYLGRWEFTVRNHRAVGKLTDLILRPPGHSQFPVSCHGRREMKQWLSLPSMEEQPQGGILLSSQE